MISILNLCILLWFAVTSMHAENSFGARLRLLRRRARLTQAELGRAVGYSDAQISRLEMGRRPPDLSTLVALVFPALGLDPQARPKRMRC
ncbi:MAG: helix-turn-helix transcriptional regulator, partial [Blastochloris sp.]|nr:helix-turn-helix transcriptional regulator [Blastochloris sp.]